MPHPVSPLQSDPGDSKVAEFRTEVLTRFLYIGSVVSVAAVPAYWLMGSKPLAIAIGVYACAVVLLCYVHNVLRVGREHGADAFLAMTVFVTFSGIYFGNEVIDNKPWQMLVPFIAFLVAGSRRGIGWAIADLVGLAVIFYLRRHSYEPLSVLILLMAHPTVAYAMYVFARSNEANIRAISRLSHTDSLTKTYNRQLFDELFVNLFNRARRSEEALAVYMIDIDHFKLYNDNYGHIAGDRALRQVADVIRGSARRATDLVFRYGGEEFCVVSSGVSSNDALFIAESIIDGVRDLNMPHTAGTNGQLTVSIGVTYAWGLEDFDTEALLRRADRALYAAKTGGRDRLEMDSADGPLTPELAVAS